MWCPVIPGEWLLGSYPETCFWDVRTCAPLRLDVLRPRRTLGRRCQVTNARLVERALVKVEFNGVCHSLVGATCSAKKRQAPRRGHCTRKTKPEPGVLGSTVFTEASAERVGSHICRPVKKSWHATFHSITNGRSAPPAVNKAIDSALVLTIADPQK